jgi:ketosteroid isomerase-like protein
MPMNPTEVVSALLASWNNRDLDGFVGMLTEDVEWYDLGMLHTPARGRQAVRAFAESVLAAFPDFEYSIQHPLCVSPGQTRCVALWKITATHSAILNPPGFAPTGRCASFQGVDVFEFQGESISRITTFFDPIQAAEQLTGMALRFPSGSFREQIVVLVQCVIAYFSRRRLRAAA